MTEPTISAVAAVQVRDVFYGYSTPGGTVMALRGLSLAVARGERVVVHGPNGSGKSTLMRLLLGEEVPSSGRIEIDGTEMSRLDPGARRLVRLNRIGYVDQHAMRSLVPELNVRDNVAMQLELSGSGRKAARSTAEVSLASLGLNGLSRRATTSLSGGEAQRVAICAAVAHRPALILADEPTGELDAEAADEVYSLLMAAATQQGASLVMVSHDHRAERVADRVVRIRDGRLSEQWEPGSRRSEVLVVDDRGWVRIPADLRASWPPGTTLSIGAGGSPGESVVLLPQRPVQPPEPSRHLSPSAGSEYWAAPTSAAKGAGRLDFAAKAAGPRDPAPRGGPGTAPIAQVSQVDGAGPARSRPVTTPIALISRVDLSFGGRPVLEQLTLEVVPGKLTVVAGPSGSGKSSLLRVLAGLADPDSGYVELDGTRLAGLNRAARARIRRRLAGVALQRTFLAESLTVRENLELARTVRRLEGAPVRLADTAAELDLSGLLDQPVGLLSGGERQRVGLARCLVVDRPLLILDEPTSQQDEASAEMVVAALRRATGRSIAILAATHDPAVMEAADEVRRLGREVTAAH